MRRPLPHSGTYPEMCNRPRSHSDSTSTICETHSYPNLSSEVDSVDKPGTHSMPDHLKVGHYDGMVLYAEPDRPKVMDFLKHLHSDIRLKDGDPIKCVPYDGEELSGLSGLEFDQLDKAFGRCSITFMFITKTFVNDVWCKISHESVLMRMIRDKHLQWRVVPVYTKRLDDCDFNIPMGLNALKGISYYQNDEFYRRGVSSLIEKTVSERREKERRLLRQRSDWLKNHGRCQNDLAQEHDENSGRTDDISISMVQPQQSRYFCTLSKEFLKIFQARERKS